MFAFGGKLYILNGVDYYCYDGNTLSAAAGYAPLILIACDPSDGSGTLYEEINLLSLQRRQRFNTNGSTRNFHFTEKNINKVDWVKFNGETLASNAYTFSKTYGAITMTTAPAAATDALEVCYTLEESESRRSVITHYQRLLDYIVPDFVHVLFRGRIIYSGDKSLALKLEKEGYDWLIDQYAE